jgi:hypothetical protein
VGFEISWDSDADLQRVVKSGTSWGINYPVSRIQIYASYTDYKTQVCKCPKPGIWDLFRVWAGLKFIHPWDLSSTLSWGAELESSIVESDGFRQRKICKLFCIDLACGNQIPELLSPHNSWCSWTNELPTTMVMMRSLPMRDLNLHVHDCCKFYK